MATTLVEPAESDSAGATEVRSPWVPCIVAWLFPGAGHLALGQTVSAAVFACVVLVTFGTGIFLHGTVYALDAEQPLSYLATFANLGAGPLDLWARYATFGQIQYRIPDSQVDRGMRERTLRMVRQRTAQPSHTYGRTFLLTAGLMNLLLVLDVYDSCIGRKGPPGPPAEPSSP